MVNIITLSIDNEIIDKLDNIRKSSNISRSKLIRDVLRNFCNDGKLIKKVLDDE